MQTPDLNDIQKAAERIAPYVRRTPLLFSEELNQKTGLNLVFKAENLQHCGAFKFRGACNAVFGLDEATARRGVTTSSSGNHASALAYASQLRGIEANIVVPNNAPKVKKRRALAAGAIIHECEPTLQARQSGVAKIIAERGAHFVPSFNDTRIISGQATAMLEAHEDGGPFDLVLVPLGGGGLLSGVLVYVRAVDHSVTVWGAEPQGADDAYMSFHSGQLVPSIEPQTIADGLLTGMGDITWPIIQSKVNDIQTVEDHEIIVAMHMLWQYLNIIVEPSGAVSFAVALKHAQQLQGQRVLIVLSGGNVDLPYAFQLFEQLA